MLLACYVAYPGDSGSVSSRVVVIRSLSPINIEPFSAVMVVVLKSRMLSNSFSLSFRSPCNYFIFMSYFTISSFCYNISIFMNPVSSLSFLIWSFFCFSNFLRPSMIASFSVVLMEYLVSFTSSYGVSISKISS